MNKTIVSYVHICMVETIKGLKTKNKYSVKTMKALLPKYLLIHYNNISYKIYEIICVQILKY